MKRQAETLEQDVIASGKMNGTCDLGGLLLQIGIVICSIGILVSWDLFWYVGAAPGLVGTVIGATALFR